MTTPARFQRFCTSDGFRFAMAAPFVQAGYLYATNGRVAVRTATDEPDTIAPGLRFPRMDSIDWGPSGQCSEKWPPPADHKGKERETIQVGNRSLAIALARKVRRLPGPISFNPSGKPDAPLAFTADDGTIEGIIMPMAK